MLRFKDCEHCWNQLREGTNLVHFVNFTHNLMVPLDSMFCISLSLFFTLFSNKMESKDIRRQNKTLSATVLKLTKTVQQLEDENQELKKELTQEEMSMMDSPVCRAKGTYIYKGAS